MHLTWGEEADFACMKTSHARVCQMILDGQCLFAYTRHAYTADNQVFVQCKQGPFAYTRLTLCLHSPLFSLPLHSKGWAKNILSYGSVKIILWSRKNYPMEQENLVRRLSVKPKVGKSAGKV